MKLPERNRWGRLPGYPINPWVAKLRRSLRRFLRARDAEAQESWTWGKGGGATRHNVTESVPTDRLTIQQVTNLASELCTLYGTEPWDSLSLLGRGLWLKETKGILDRAGIAYVKKEPQHER